MNNFDNFFNFNSINIKFFDSLFNDSNLQWGMYGKNGERYFKDKTTDIFTKFFLADDKLRWMFVDYVFNSFNSIITLKINKLLLEKYETYLYPEEKIYLVFKGGNVMNFYYSLLKNQIDKYKIINCDLEISNGLLLKDINKYLKELENNFQISDVDFSLYIECKDYVKNEKISNCCKIIILDVMKDIINNFDDYFNSINGHVEPELSEVIIEKTDDELNEYFDDIIFLIDKLTKEQFDTSIHLGEGINDTIELIKSIHQLTKLYDLCERKALEFGFDINDKLVLIADLINDILTKKFNNIKANKFYTSNKIENFISALKTLYQNEKFCVKFKDQYENQKHNISIFVYEGLKDVNINIEPRKSAIVYTRQNLKRPLKILSSDFKKIHYITYNGTILKDRFSGISNFDLFRVKFNVQVDNINEYSISFLPDTNAQQNYDLLVNILQIKQDEVNKINKDLVSRGLTGDKQIFNSFSELRDLFDLHNIGLNIIDKKHTLIPSEFIDISIPNYTDKTAIHFIESIQDELSYLQTTIDNNLYFTNCYSQIQIYDDLCVVLFQQNTFFPWDDKKYEKRIKRLITMLIISNLEDIDGVYKIKSYMRRKIKELINTCIIIYNDVISGTDYEINSLDISKYLNLDNITIPITEDIAKYILQTMDIDHEYIDFRYIFKISNKYSEIKYLLNFIFVYYKLFSKVSDANNLNIIKFMNVYKEKQLWENFDITNANEILEELKENFVSLLKSIIYTGRLLLIIF